MRRGNGLIVLALLYSISFILEQWEYIKIILTIVGIIFIFFKIISYIKNHNEDKRRKGENKDFSSSNFREEHTYKEEHEEELKKSEGSNRGTKKGEIGEQLIVTELKQLRDNRGRVLTNIYIPKSSESETTEIDIIFIHPTGIYVIESKNYTGKVYGGIDTYNWAYYLNNVKYLFYNPITQNKNHIKHLSRLLEIPEDKFKSIIVFGDKSKIVKIEGYSDSCNFKVIKTSDVRSLMIDNIVKEPEILSEYGVACLFDKLEKYTDISQEDLEKHKENIREKFVSTN